MDGVSVFQGDPGGNVKMTEGETIRDAWGNGQTIVRSVLQFQGFFSVLDAVYTSQSKGPENEQFSIQNIE